MHIKEHLRLGLVMSTGAQTPACEHCVSVTHPTAPSEQEAHVTSDQALHEMIAQHIPAVAYCTSLCGATEGGLTPDLQSEDGAGHQKTSF